MGVDRSELVCPLEAYNSFNDFIVREIDLAKRPIDPDPAVCVAPADGRVMVYPKIDVEQTFHIKRAVFDLRSFLRDEELAMLYNGGAMAVIRLYLADYHHVHFPADGVPRACRSIPGRYLAVSPYAKTRFVPFFGENFRSITMFDSRRFGRVAMVDVGAFTVGSIQQRFVPDGPV